MEVQKTRDISMLSESMWLKALLPIKSSVQDVIRSLNESTLKIVLVVDDLGVLQGTISDGDIRRGLLKGLNLESGISNIIQRNALVVPPTLGRESVLNLMVVNKVQQIPVVDDKDSITSAYRKLPEATCNGTRKADAGAHCRTRKARRF
jgi:CBS domain-containing protein